MDVEALSTLVVELLAAAVMVGRVLNAFAGVPHMAALERLVPRLRVGVKDHSLSLAVHEALRHFAIAEGVGGRRHGEREHEEGAHGLLFGDTHKVTTRRSSRPSNLFHYR